MTRRLFEHLGFIGQQIAAAPHVLLGLDYDGTLTPLVNDPTEATLLPETRDVLRSLVGIPGLSVAIVSGRALDNLRSMVGLDGLIYAGSHGMDISGPGLRFVESTAVVEQEAMGKLSRDLASRLRSVDGAFVEDKALTVSVHYRRVAAQESDTVRRAVEDSIAEVNHRFRITLGHKVFEIRPRVGWNKGMATAWIREQLGNENTLVLYLGDDETDEDAFQALRGEITIKIGDSSDTSAHYYVETPANVREFLHWLQQTVHKRS